jgi:predicted molibdopterin-dependent oxidoreductase YjgC
MGAYATAFPGGVPITPESAASLAAHYGFPVGERTGLTAEEMIERASRGEIDVLYSSGGNFLDVLPEPEFVHGALQRVPLRVHQDIVVSSQMLVDPADTVVLLPAATRYEQRGGGTETTTERRIAFGPELGHQVGEARSEWEIFVDLARYVDPDRSHLASFDSGQAIRDEIARVVPTYAGIEDLHAIGDSVQWGGPRLCEGGRFPTSDGKAHFVAVEPADRGRPEGTFLLSTRRGKQFNTMVHSTTDPLTGAARDALFMARADALALGVHEGERVVVTSDVGSLQARVHLADVHPGNVQVFFPEGNVLLRSARRDLASGVPDYNAIVTVERL